MRDYPPQNEQDLCVACGFCCDNTLFEYAYLKPGEVVSGHFQKSKFTIEQSDYFRLPCPHFKGCCSIYDQDKPSICSDFKCKLLKSFANDELEKFRALAIIEQAKKLRSEVLELYRNFNQEPSASFREVLKFVNAEQRDSDTFKVLRAKTNLLSILLIRYFKSKETFDELLEPAKI